MAASFSAITTATWRALSLVWPAEFLVVDTQWDTRPTGIPAQTRRRAIAYSLADDHLSFTGGLAERRCRSIGIDARAEVVPVPIALGCVVSGFRELLTLVLK